VPLNKVTTEKLVKKSQKCREKNELQVPDMSREFEAAKEQCRESEECQEEEQQSQDKLLAPKTHPWHLQILESLLEKLLSRKLLLSRRHSCASPRHASGSKRSKWISDNGSKSASIASAAAQKFAV
jgi:uncharacterized protein HemX